MIRRAALPLLLCAACDSQSAAPPVAAPQVRHVPYDAGLITTVHVQRGTATRIVLASDEKILADGAASGFDGDCGVADAEWCIRADAGSNVILVKPKDGATHNNLELRTDQRDYSFRFQVVPDRAKTGSKSTSAAAQRQGQLSATPDYRVVFRYQPRIKTLDTAADAAPPRTARELLAEARPVPRNWRYSMQVMDGAAAFAPELVFDDGRFTYFRFPANRELPTVFYVSSAGEEGRVNFHIDAHAPDTVVAERLAPQFILRLGKTAIGVWNDAFDATGLAPRDGTAVDGVTRVLR
jgi:type IV secretion system protein VirB9